MKLLEMIGGGLCHDGQANFSCLEHIFDRVICESLVVLRNLNVNILNVARYARTSKMME